MDRLCCDFRVVGPVQTNCYFLYHEDNKEFLIFDPGDQAEQIINFINKDKNSLIILSFNSLSICLNGSSIINTSDGYINALAIDTL